MPREAMSWGCVTGRFQPVHTQHVELFSHAADRHAGLVVAITNPDPTALRREDASAHRHLAESNPYTFFERSRMVLAALESQVHDGTIAIVPFDLTKPQVWPAYVPMGTTQYVRRRGPWEDEKAARLEAAGYRVVRVDPSGDPDVSGTGIRQRLQQDALAPLDDVPAGVAALLRQLAEEQRSRGNSC